MKPVENCKTLLRDIKTLNKWRDSSWLTDWRMNFSKLSILNLIYKFKVIPIKISIVFTEFDTLITGNMEELRTAKANMKNNVITSLDTKTYPAP